MKMRRLLAAIVCAVMVLTTFTAGMVTVSADDSSNNRNYFYNFTYDKDKMEIFTQALIDGVTDFSDMDKYGINKNNYWDMFYYAKYNNPEIVGVITFYRQYLLNGDVTKGYYAEYEADKAERSAALQARLPEVMKEVKRLIPKGASQFEKVHIVHDYLISSTAYDKDNAVADTVDPGHHMYDASGPLVKHFAVCQGYSLAFSYIMKELGIDCAYVISTKSNHGWNLVKIDGEWYHVDTSADDPVYDILGRVSHRYLCLSTESLLEISPDRSDFIVLSEDTGLVFNDETCAKSKKYESGQLWNSSNSACHYYNGDLYTVGEDNALYKNGELYYLPEGHMQWHPFGIESAMFYEAHGKINGYGNLIYMLTPKSIIRINLDTGVKEVCYQPELDYGYQIFGLARVNGELYCTINNNVPAANEEWIKVPIAADPAPEIQEDEPGDDPGDNPGGDTPGEENVPAHSYEKTVSLIEGESITLTDESGDYSSDYNDAITDRSVANVTITGKTIGGQAAIPEKYSALSGFSTGEYLIGAVSGGKTYYLTRSGSSLSYTADASEATRWSVSGSSSAATIKSDNYYLVHSTSAVSLSTSSSNSSWIFTSGGLAFKQTSSSWFRSSSTTYYLTFSSSKFTVAKSTSVKATEYSYTPAVPAVPGSAVTQIKLDAIAEGSTSVLVGETLYTVNVEKKPPVTQVITVSTKDNFGQTLKADYTISGLEGTDYSINPPAIQGYIAPAVISGTYEAEETGKITLVYTLNTDKSALKALLDSKISQGNYTDDSYNAYLAAYNSGKTVYDNQKALQSQADQATANINAAISALVEKVIPEYCFKLDTSGASSGNEFIIASSGYMLTASNGSLTRVAASVSNNTITEVDDNSIWLLTSSSSGYTIKNKGTGQYLSMSVSGSWLSKKASLTLSSASTVWNTSKSGSYSRFYASSGSTKYYLTYSSGFSLANRSSSSANMSLYRGQ